MVLSLPILVKPLVADTIFVEQSHEQLRDRNESNAYAGSITW